MLGNRTRKNILYLDQNFLSSVHRGGEENEWATALMSRITQLLDLQLLAIPYSSTHIDEADLNGEYRDALVMFIQRVSRGHHFEPSYRVKETQILKAFQRFLNGEPASLDRDERDALCLSVHDWDSAYSVNLFSGARDPDRKAALKQEALNEFIQTLPQWAKNGRTFEEDMSLELSDEARLLIDSFVDKSARLRVGDFSALIDAPIDASIGEGLWMLAQSRKIDPKAIGEFLRSEHFALVPAVQLSARLFSAYKEQLRFAKTPPDPTSKRTRNKLSGFFYDIQHAATYAPYCDGYFTDNAMAKLLKGDRVNIEPEYGCRVFSRDTQDDFLVWLKAQESQMPPQHADDLSWAYPKRFRLPIG